MRMRAWMMSLLVLDRVEQTTSYQQFLVALREKVRQAASYPALDAETRAVAGPWVLGEYWPLGHNGTGVGMSFGGPDTEMGYRATCVIIGLGLRTHARLPRIL